MQDKLTLWISIIWTSQRLIMRVEQFCQDLLASYASQLTTLGLTAWVEALQAKNQEFQEAMRARTDEQADYVKGELTQLRQQRNRLHRHRQPRE